MIRSQLDKVYTLPDPQVVNVYLGTNQALPKNTWVYVEYDTIQSDINGWFDIGNHKIIIGEEGFYNISGATMVSFAEVGIVYHMRLKISNVSVSYNIVHSGVNNALSMVFAWSGEVNKDDFVQVDMTSKSALTDTYINAHQSFTYLSLSRIK